MRIISTLQIFFFKDFCYKSLRLCNFISVTQITESLTQHNNSIQYLADKTVLEGKRRAGHKNYLPTLRIYPAEYFHTRGVNETFVFPTQLFRLE